MVFPFWLFERNGPVLISGMMDLSRPLQLLLAMVPPLINWSLAHQQLRFPSLAVPFRRVTLAGVASETVKTVRAPLVTKPTRLGTDLDISRPLTLKVGSRNPHACWNGGASPPHGQHNFILNGRAIRLFPHVAGCWRPVMSLRLKRWFPQAHPSTLFYAGFSVLTAACNISTPTTPRTALCLRIITAHSPTIKTAESPFSHLIDKRKQPCCIISRFDCWLLSFQYVTALHVTLRLRVA